MATAAHFLSIYTGLSGTIPPRLKTQQQELADLNAELPDVAVQQCKEAGEIADTAVFIFENDYLTGRVIETDGGIRL